MLFSIFSVLFFGLFFWNLLVNVWKRICIFLNFEWCWDSLWSKRKTWNILVVSSLLRQYKRRWVAASMNWKVRHIAAKETEIWSPAAAVVAILTRMRRRTEAPLIFSEPRAPQSTAWNDGGSVFWFTIICVCTYEWNKFGLFRSTLFTF